MPGADADAWLIEVRAVLREVLRSDATELELADSALRLRVKRRATAADAAAAVAAPGPAVSSAEQGGGSLVALPAPLTGIFYAAPAPGARPYVAVGDWVEAGGVVGLIEAMKVFNEVTAEQPGSVVGILAAEGALVQADEPLLLLDPTAPPPAGRDVAGG